VPASLSVHFDSCLLKHQTIVTSHSLSEITLKYTFGSAVGVHFEILNNEYVVVYSHTVLLSYLLRRWTRRVARILGKKNA
jgi:hypothetical protein